MRSVCGLVIVLLVGQGCAYVEAQGRLVEQARRGVGLCVSDMERQQQRAEEIHELQRRRLDEAFDRDVIQRPALSAEWVIEHRKAYALGLATLHREHSAAVEADAAMRRNLEAVDAALAHLEALQSLPVRFVEEVRR